MPDFDDRSGRDTRLLALVIVIAVAVLAGLARFRFPQTADSRPAAVTPGPLERLAARATYDDLAAAVHTALQRVEPALITVNLEAEAPAGKTTGTARGDSASADTEPRYGEGIRLDGEWAVVHVPRGFRVARTSAADSLVVREVDPTKQIAIVSQPLGSDDDKLPSGVAELTWFTYVCVVEPTADGPTAMPVFIGRVRALLDERWHDSVLVMGGSPDLPVGALVFQLDGRFLGLIVAQPNGATSLVPASLLSTVVSRARARATGGSR